MKYRKKPVEIEAIQFSNRLDAALILEWAQDKINYNADNSSGALLEYLSIKTLEGEMKASLGDWIIKGIKGEFYPCKPDIFKATYDKVEV